MTGPRVPRACFAAFALATVSPCMVAAEPPRTEPPALAAREAELLDRFRELERSFLRLADLLAATDPRRADALRAAFDRAREEAVGDRLAAIVAMLEQGQLLKANASQEEAIAEFRGLLAVLEAGAGEQRAAEAAKQVRAYLGRIAALIAKQRELEGRTEAGGEPEALVDRQRKTAEEARDLGADVKRFAQDLGADGGQPGPAGGETKEEADGEAARSRRTAERLAVAEQRMLAARDRLEQAEAGAARAEQERAVEELESARAELEEILRQMREEEVTRLLVQLEARLRGMLKQERVVLADTERLAAAPGQPDRERQLETARLGRDQSAITVEAAKALALLADDGSAVAMPQALAQVHDDSAQAAARLGRGDAGGDTLGLLGDIVTGLEEMLAAVEKARADQPDADAPPGGGQQAAAGEQPLVDKLSELKMLRTLQVRVNTRTQRLARLLDGGDAAADRPEQRAALARLAERQRAIERAARNIVAGLSE